MLEKTVGIIHWPKCIRLNFNNAHSVVSPFPRTNFRQPDIFHGSSEAAIPTTAGVGPRRKCSPSANHISDENSEARTCTSQVQVPIVAGHNLQQRHTGLFGPSVKCFRQLKFVVGLWLRRLPTDQSPTRHSGHCHARHALLACTTTGQASAFASFDFGCVRAAHFRAFNAPGSDCSWVQARRLCGPPRMGCALCRSLYGVRGLVKFAVAIYLFLVVVGQAKPHPVRVSTGAPLGRQSMVWIYGPWSFQGRRRRQDRGIEGNGAGGDTSIAVTWRAATANPAGLPGICNCPLRRLQGLVKGEEKEGQVWRVGYSLLSAPDRELICFHSSDGRRLVVHCPAPLPRQTAKVWNKKKGTNTPRQTALAIQPFWILEPKCSRCHFGWCLKTSAFHRTCHTWKWHNKTLYHHISASFLK